ncbi:MAG TPA: glutamate--tRNA ligase [Spirochaetia bacterium]|nr:MAG: glutamate--tRNA ligase [Spirochaetes bacterium GWB1_36_13]HCL57368.1 glutamate--tRNA ligase [Spirochaetia bacterium]
MEVRTRFAPSPTGSMHVGNARTAIFNWLFARHHNGKFILRIEDTDLERSTRENEEKLIEDLKWLKIDWDEEPVRQSDRTKIYEEYALRLVKEKKAFFCFCTDEVLSSKREKMMAEKKAPHYDGSCSRLSDQEIEENLKKGVPYSIRFKVDQKDIIFQDLIKGEVNIKAGMFGDFVLIRSNKMPVYNFSVVVDDALMKITHVIRAEEHLSNTARQIILYQALGFPVPFFAHTALILADDGSKLSKRHGATSVEEYRKKGYLSDGLFNYLSILGWTPPEEGKDKLSRKELIQFFDTDRVAKSPAKFDLSKLNWLNGEYIKEIPFEELRPVLLSLMGQNYDLFFYNQDEIEKILLLGARSLSYLSQIIKEVELFFISPENISKPLSLDEWKQEPHTALVKRFYEEVSKAETLNEEFFGTLLKNLGKELGAKGKNLFMPIRLFATGQEHGPDLNTVLTLLGKNKILKIIEQCLSF